MFPEFEAKVIKNPKDDSIHASIKKYQDKYYLFAVSVKENPIDAELGIEELKTNLGIENKFRDLGNKNKLRD